MQLVVTFTAVALLSVSTVAFPVTHTGPARVELGGGAVRLFVDEVGAAGCQKSRRVVPDLDADIEARDRSAVDVEAAPGCRQNTMKWPGVGPIRGPVT